MHSLAERHMLSAATVPAAEYFGLKGCQVLHECYLLPACQVVPMRSPRLLEQNLLKRVSLIFLQCFFWMYRYLYTGSMPRQMPPTA